MIASAGTCQERKGSEEELRLTIRQGSERRSAYLELGIGADADAVVVVLCLAARS
jgi:hypothetical protein